MFQGGAEQGGRCPNTTSSTGRFQNSKHWLFSSRFHSSSSSHISRGCGAVSPCLGPGSSCEEHDNTFTCYCAKVLSSLYNQWYTQHHHHHLIPGEDWQVLWKSCRHGGSRCRGLHRQKPRCGEMQRFSQNIWSKFSHLHLSKKIWEITVAQIVSVFESFPNSQVRSPSSPNPGVSISLEVKPSTLNGILISSSQFTLRLVDIWDNKV